MNIQINEQYRITSDAYNVIVQERTVTGEKAKVQGVESWTVVSYHNTLENACLWLVNHEIKMSGADTMQSVLDTQTRITKEIIEAVKAAKK